jgi:uncharacterized membrane protein
MSSHRPVHRVAVMDVGVVPFEHTAAADHAFADARDRDPGAAWLNEVAFVEVHRRGRLVVRGSVAGRYLDIDDEGDLIGRDTAVGTIAGAAVGFALGPLGFAVGVVAGGSVGGAIEASHVPRLDGPAVAAIRERMPERSSAIVLFSDPARVEAMLVALERPGGRSARYRLAPAAEAELREAIAEMPDAEAPA